MAAGFTAKAEELGMDPLVMLANDADPQAVLSSASRRSRRVSPASCSRRTTRHWCRSSTTLSRTDIPLVFTHSDVPEGEAAGALANFHPDPTQYGAAMAQTIGEAIGGTGTVAITESAFNSRSRTTQQLRSPPR